MQLAGPVYRCDEKALTDQDLEVYLQFLQLPFKVGIISMTRIKIKF